MSASDATAESRWVGSWRADIAVRIDELEHRLNVVRHRGRPVPAPSENVEIVEALHAGGETAVMAVEIQGAKGGAADDPTWPAHVEAVEEALGRAAKALEVPNRWRRLKQWWTGSSITVAWESVHDAEAELVELEPPADVAATLPRLEAWIKDVVPDKDLRERYLKKIRSYMEGGEIDRRQIRQAHQAVTVANNEKHADTRAFRNRLLIASGFLTALLLGAAAWHVLNTSFLPLCGEVGTDQKTRICYGIGNAADVDAAHATAVFEVLLVGAVGGLLSAAFTLGGTRQVPPRYSLRGPQMLLKPIAGAATALLGVLVVLSGLLVAPVSTSAAVLVAYAGIFGFAQQLFTRFVDGKADALIGEEDNKEEKDQAKTRGGA